MCGGGGRIRLWGTAAAARIGYKGTCVCVCVREREREREGGRGRERGRNRKREEHERQRKTERESGRVTGPCVWSERVSE